MIKVVMIKRLGNVCQSWSDAPWSQMEGAMLKSIRIVPQDHSKTAKDGPHITRGHTQITTFFQESYSL